MDKTVVALPGEGIGVEVVNATCQYADILSDIAGQGIANPTATILSAASMLDHLGLTAESTRLEAAPARVYRDGKSLTPDQGGSATTTRTAAEVLAAYRNQS